MWMLWIAMVARAADEDLIARFKLGERAAYAELVTRYQDQVYGMCCRWLGNPEQAQDTAQDVFVAVFRALPEFRGEARFSTWIYRVVVNHCKNRKLYRQRRAWGRHDGIDVAPSEDKPVLQVASDTPGTERGAEQSELSAAVHAALARLDEDQRSIILLRDVDDLDYEEIAEILDVPRGTVKSRLHRARAELAKAIERVHRREDVL